MTIIASGMIVMNQDPLVWLEALKRVKASAELEAKIVSGELFDAIDGGQQEGTDKPFVMFAFGFDEEFEEEVKRLFPDLYDELELLANTSIPRMLNPDMGNVREQVEALGIKIVNRYEGHPYREAINLDMGKYYL